MDKERKREIEQKDVELAALAKTLGITIKPSAVFKSGRKNK